ncbi:filamentous hemagglutinin N-terminal domain-containing protein [Candidatus Albibeggiatoa sp. nov. NOAA]|uniref:two-partner secretion domain-containing protein n=1 Tax=Candidatus Albibeggiatoa sp. nov. NOAA TaxID=3162724 RepID=UPI0032FF2B1C|nr:filamentous hemagglutinin N-terminal domain-containing protein [Thiotrichaceae bacterium]
MRAIVWVFVCVVTSAAQAEISINNAQLSIDSGLYNISQDVGQTVGNNLFHTFDSFNLNQGEIAQFSGNDSIQNIISRVIGGETSLINGTIRSTIPNADFYFLNPYGIVFGEHAQLDLQGSFHASTADYLKLSDGGEFHAQFPERDILTTASVENFGFLDNSIATINLQNTHLFVPAGKSLSLIGGDLDLSGESVVLFDEEHYQALSADMALTAKQINLVSVASQGEVILDESDLSINAEGGTIHLDKTLIDASGKGAGAIFIRGGQLLMSDTSIQSNTLAEQDGLTIDLQLTKLIDILNHAAQQVLIAKTFDSGKGADVKLTTPNLKLSNATINLSSLGGGDAGSLNLNATQAKFDASQIRSSAFGQGKSSSYDINVKESLILTGQMNQIVKNDGIEQPNTPAQITSTTSSAEGEGGFITMNTGNLKIEGGVVGVSSFSQQQTGNLTIKANNIDVNAGGLIISSSNGEGHAGNMTLTIKDTLSVSGMRNGSYITRGLEFKDNFSGITSIAFQGNGGNITISAATIKLADGGIGAPSVGKASKSGIITIHTDNLEMYRGGRINNSNRGLKGQNYLIGSSEGNVINIDAKAIKITGAGSGILSETHSLGKGGNIEIQAEDIVLEEKGAISALSANIGEAGQIKIDADNIYIRSQGKISTDAQNGFGGEITLNSSGLTYLQQGQIITSVHGGNGNGGNISITNPQFLVLNQAQIIAQADAGQGGNIRIVADQFLQSSTSLVSASSRLGIDGNIEITSPDENVSGGLLALDNHFVEQVKIRDTCKEAIAGQLPTEFQLPLTFKANMHRFPNDFVNDWIPSAMPRSESCR